MRVIGKENRIFFYQYLAFVGVVGWYSDFTKFEWCMGFASANALYLLICVTDYLHLIGESIEDIRDK